MDTYIDLSARSLLTIKKFVSTYSKNKDELMYEYPEDAFGKKIDWGLVNTEKEKTLSDIKACLLKEIPKSDNLIVREGYYEISTEN